MGLKDAVKKAAFVDILRGMSVTGSYFIEEKVTVEYPKEKVQTYPRFRGAHALLSDPATGDTKCVACMLCPTVCPSQCITVIGEQTPDGRSHPAVFEIELSRCVFCGMCEEVCPVAAIVMTRVYELATTDKRDFRLTKEWLMANAVNVRKEVFARPGQATRATPPAVAGQAASSPPPVAAGQSAARQAPAGDDPPSGER